MDIPIEHVTGANRRRRGGWLRWCSRFQCVRRSTSRRSSRRVLRQANELLLAWGAPGLSGQAWALVPKLIEAATIADGDARVFEVHPEVSFRELAGRSLAWSKKSWNGLLLRRRLLADAGIVLPEVIAEVAGTTSDDIVDAAAAAWSARRIATGAAYSFPDPPGEFRRTKGGHLVLSRLGARRVRRL